MVEFEEQICKFIMRFMRTLDEFSKKSA